MVRCKHRSNSRKVSTLTKRDGDDVYVWNTKE